MTYENACYVAKLDYAVTLSYIIVIDSDGQIDVLPWIAEGYNMGTIVNKTELPRTHLGGTTR